MRLIYVNHNDSFAGNVSASANRAVKRYNPKSEVIRYASDTDISVLVKENPDMILLGPGPGSPENAGNYSEVFERFHRTHPIFGICLGFQKMMHYFRKPVRVLEEAVHGAASEITHIKTGIFKGIKSPSLFGRYHSLGIYADEIPDCFKVLATCPDSNGRLIVMAAQHKTLQIAGVQFHPESFLSTADNAGQTLMNNVIRELYIKRRRR